VTPDVQTKLAALNREFYEAFGADFAETRPRLAPGVQRVLDQIPAGCRVLEIGCGDGKVGRRLAARGVAYLGVDASATLLERAERYTQELRSKIDDSIFNHELSIIFTQADVLAPGWDLALGHQSFDWILTFAVFHHLPSGEARAGLLRTLAQRLAPGGTVALSNWQFTRSKRLKQRLRPWSELGLRDSDVEPNDYVLIWERGGRRGLRYVHLLEEAEARALAERAGLYMQEVFSADGVTGDLAEYVLLVRQSGGLVVK
jgi:2-polyprenyl-3-methyl-5-hydroxy-6-metoxy-1,4-benzoquinol methylase